jgi:hypothetical protein
MKTDQGKDSVQRDESPLPALASIRHPVADDDEIESYARGVISGRMTQATPNVVGSLLARIRKLLAVEEDREHLRRQIRDLNRGIQNRAKCATCGDPLGSTCPKCQRQWES